MSKAKSKKNTKSHLTVEEKKLGKTHIYILIGMIVAGIVAGLYYIQ